MGGKRIVCGCVLMFSCSVFFFCMHDRKDLGDGRIPAICFHALTMRVLCILLIEQILTSFFLSLNSLLFRPLFLFFFVCFGTDVDCCDTYNLFAFALWILCFLFCG